MGAARQFGVNWVKKHKQQRGMSLTSIIFVLVILGSLLVLAMRIIPAVVEYQSIRNAVAQAKTAGGTIGDIRRAFDRNAGVNDVTSITGKDLEITKNGDQTEIAYAYERRISLTDHAELVLKFSGNTDPNPKGSSKTAAADQ